jgi:uncharacterized protein (PEP-CTERM system associated)
MGITLTTNNPSLVSGRARPSPALASTFVIAAVMWPAFAQAAEWRIAPTVSARGTYTDNVRLAPSGAEKSDFISEVTPGISVTATGARLKFSGTYGLQFQNYADDSEGNRVSHQLAARANAELVDNLFFVDGSASVSQQNISAFGPQPIDNISVIGNRATVRTYTISPYLRHDFGSTASTVARYTRTTTTASSGALSGADIDAVSVGLNSGPSFRTVGWGLQHSQTKNHFNDAARVGTETVDSQTTTATLRYLVTPQFDLIATGGYDKYDYESITGEAPSGRFYTVGFAWRPTERTSLAANAGRHFYGNTYMLESSVRSRQTVWSINYNEGITTSQSQFAIQTTTSTSDFLNQLFLSSIPDPVARQRAVDRFILSTGVPTSLTRSVNYFSNQFFLQKSLQASVAVTGAKNTVVVSLYNTSRKSQTALSGTDALFGGFSQALDANTKQTGINGLWNWRLTNLTNATFNALYARTRLETTGALQKQKALRFVLATQLRPKLDGGIELRRQMLTSELAAGDYTENAIMAFLTMRF